MAQDSIKVKGHAILRLIDEDGNIKDVREAENMIVSGGLVTICDALANVTNTYLCSGMGIGTGTTGPAASDVNLETSAAYVALTSAGKAAAAASAHSVIYTATFNPGAGTGAITEAVICCAASAYGDKAVGRILNRLTFAVINKAAADSLAITWTVVFADA
jgi:hypothetical protein